MAALVSFVSSLFDHSTITILPATELFHRRFWTDDAGIEGILLAASVFLILQDAFWFATSAPREYLLPNNTYDVTDWTLTAHAVLFLSQLCLLVFPARLLANLVFGASSPYAAQAAELVHFTGALVSLEILFYHVMLARIEGYAGDQLAKGAAKSESAVNGGGAGGSPKARKKKTKKNRKDKARAKLEAEAEHLVKGTLERLGDRLPRGWSRVPCDVWTTSKL
ncbi:hypothetical protein C8A03DRAFT_31807 [Achaetomium macrosporum]|uniref:Uncharacterized protein n=1 Tax=Achaetomium macrosporum TaxID=79813 RepID=A0AAN7CDP1_9PEZI|nr:hypothetical protein C8A03DRAFT_31807 [Achaetomium macrosporum]